MNPSNASQSTVCGLAWKRYSRQTPLRDVAPALNGRASLAGAHPLSDTAVASDIAVTKFHRQLLVECTATASLKSPCPTRLRLPAPASGTQTGRNCYLLPLIWF